MYFISAFRRYRLHAANQYVADVERADARRLLLSELAVRNPALDSRMAATMRRSVIKALCATLFKMFEKRLCWGNIF